MDTSGTYIKMCERAGEIQTKSQPIHIMESLEVFVYDGDEVWFHYAVGKGKDMVIRKVWLPRQDQLQEMVGEDVYTNIKNAMWSVLDDLHKFAFNSDWSGFIPLTMEQLWLAFVMKEKYNKVWSGTKWVKEMAK